MKLTDLNTVGEPILNKTMSNKQVTFVIVLEVVIAL